MENTNVCCEKKEIKICKICGKTSDQVKFQPKKRRCIPCNSKISNAKVGNEYFRKYNCSYLYF